MMKCAVFAVVAFVSQIALVSNSRAGDPSDLRQIDEVNLARTFAMDRSSVFSTIDAPVLVQSLPTLALLDGHRLPLTGELERAGTAPVDFGSLAFFTAVSTPRVSPASHYSSSYGIPFDGKEAPASALTTPARTYDMGGEMGMFFGKSTGKYGGEDYGGYIMGGIATDKVEITVGVSYEQSSLRIPRGRP